MDFEHFEITPPERRVRRQSSNFFLVPMILIGAVMGGLAGYGALTLIRGPVGEEVAAAEPPKVELPKPERAKQSEPAAIPSKSTKPKEQPRGAVQKLASEDPPARAEESKPAEKQEAAGEEESTPAVKEKEVEAPSMGVTLKIGNRLQRESISLAGAIRVAEVEGQSAEIEPENGHLTHTVKVKLTGSARPVLLTLSIEARGDERKLVIEPTVETDDGKDVSFTTANMDSYWRRIQKNGRRATAQLASLRSEQLDLTALINAPGMRTLADQKAMQARASDLTALIPKTQAAIEALEGQASVANEMVEFAKAIDGKCTIRLEAIVAK